MTGKVHYIPHSRHEGESHVAIDWYKIREG